MNLRLAPTTSAKTIAKLPNGTLGEVIGGPTAANGYVFWQITTGLGVGWAIEGPLQEADEPPPPPGDFEIGDVVEVLASNGINMRTAADTSAPVSKKLPNGTIGTVVGGPTTNDGYVWWQIQTSLGTGWAIGKFLFLTDDPPPSGGKFQIGDDVRVDTDALNLRSSASTSASVVTVLPANAILEVVGGPQSANGYTWWRLTSGTYGTGWSVQDFLTEV